jgi:hypothetical protein
MNLCGATGWNDAGKIGTAGFTPGKVDPCL